MDINEALELLSALSKPKGDTSHPWQIGKNYFIRTVTMAQTGKLVAVHEKELVLERAAWIADTGRFADAMADTSKFSEVEPWPADEPVIVSRAAVIDAVVIQNLPTGQK